MAVRIGALKAAIQAGLDGPALQRAPDDIREAAYATVLVSLHGLLAADAEPPSGWLRTAQLLSDTRRHFALDAAGMTTLDVYLVRIAALLDLPEVGSIGGIGDVQAVIGAAIGVGAPRYNAGNVLGCCTVYWATMQALVAAPVFRGFPGYARALAPLRSAVEADSPLLPLNAEGLDQFAWTLRRALDAVLAASG
jgi:hypothetical protein